MKDFLHKLELPEFIKDSRLTASMIIILSLSLLGSVIAMIMNPLFGLAMVLIFILTVALQFMEPIFWQAMRITSQSTCLTA